MALYEWVLAATLLLVMAVVAGLTMRSQRRVRALQQQVAELQKSALMADVDIQGLLGGQEPLILSVQIHNCAELAANRSKLGGSLSALAPNAIRGAVYKVVAKQMREQLQRQGVVADVELHRGV